MLKPIGILFLFLPLALFSLTCGTRTVKTHAGDPSKTISTQVEKKRPELERLFPATRWVPPDSEVVWVSPKMSDMASALTLFGSVFGSGVIWVSDFKEDVFMESQAAAFFLEGSALFMVLPLSSHTGAPLSDLFGEKRGGVDSTRLLGKDVYHKETHGKHWSWVSVGTHLILRIDSVTHDEQGLSWLTRSLEAGEHTSFAATEAAREAYEGKEGGNWGNVKPLAMLKFFLGEAEYLKCGMLLAKLENLSFSFIVDKNELKLDVLLPLAQQDIYSLQGFQSATALPGMMKFRETMGGYLSLALDLVLVAQSLEEASCTVLAKYIESSWSGEDWAPPPVALHIAGSHFNVSKFSGVLAIQLALRDNVFFRKQLRRIPGRSFFESTLKIKNERVKRLSVPTKSSVYYQLNAERFLFTTKKDLASTLLDSTLTASPKEELVSFGMRPKRLPQLSNLIKNTISESDGAMVEGVLAKIESLRSAILLGSKGVYLQLSLRSQTTQTSM